MSLSRVAQATILQSNLFRAAPDFYPTTPTPPLQLISQENSHLILKPRVTSRLEPNTVLIYLKVGHFTNDDMIEELLANHLSTLACFRPSTHRIHSAI